MNNLSLARSYLVKAEKRLKILDVLLADEAFSDVIREAQEIVELALKGMLRQVGIEPPKWHDVGGLIMDYQNRFPANLNIEASRLAEISAWLRKEREFSFYGDIDFIPTEQYEIEDALRAINDARFVVQTAKLVIEQDLDGN
ncbi:MAG: HEPN domain-containing protein [Chloroflexota bacterium]